MSLPWKRYPFLLRRVAISALWDNCIDVAKAAAYSALLSFFPVLASAATILVHAKAEFVSRLVVAFLFNVIPPGTEDLVRYQFVDKGERPVLVLITAALLSLWAASGVVSSLMQGFQAAYRVTELRSIPRNIEVSILLVLLAIVPLLGACALLLFGGHIDYFVSTLLSGDGVRMRVHGWWQVLYQTGRYTIAFAAIASVASLLYYYGPARRQQFRYVWRGAVFATVLWMLATSGFGWYVRNIANYNVLYGSVATTIALLVWMYLMAFIALLGCEFNAQYERMAEEAV